MNKQINEKINKKKIKERDKVELKKEKDNNNNDRNNGPKKMNHKEISTILIKRGKINNKMCSTEKILDKSLVKLINEINIKNSTKFIYYQN